MRKTDPIAYWRLGEGSGRSAYSKTGRYIGQFEGAPQLGRRGLIHNNANRAPQFDGRDDRVKVNALTSRSKSSWAKGYTMEAWVKTTTTAVEEHIMSFNLKNGGANIAIFRDEPSNKFKFHDCEGSGCVSIFSKTRPVIGRIYQVVVTVDASNHGHLYVNGRQEASFTSSMRPVHSAKFTIGADYDAGLKVTSYWHGKIDEAAVYNRALSSARITAQWAAGT